MFKKLLFIPLFVASLLFLSSCGDGVDNTPAAVTKAFLEEMADRDYSGAQRYATKGLAGTMELMELGGEEPYEVNIEILKTVENGDEAVVHFIDHDVEDWLKLIKEDGDWKVAYDKGGTDANTPAIDG